MWKKVAIIISGIGFGLATYLVGKSAARRTRISNLRLSTADLDYKHLSSEEVASQNLTDINLADTSELLSLGLNRELVDRVIENRPYRSKLELVSRIILPEADYGRIRDRIVVSEGREPIKVAS